MPLETFPWESTLNIVSAIHFLQLLKYRFSSFISFIILGSFFVACDLASLEQLAMWGGGL